MFAVNKSKKGRNKLECQLLVVKIQGNDAAECGCVTAEQMYFQVYGPFCDGRSGNQLRIPVVKHSCCG